MKMYRKGKIGWQIRQKLMNCFLAAIPILMILQTPIGAEQEKPFRIYIDADRTGNRASGIAIEQGVRTALSEVGNRLGGRMVEIVIKDHRGSSPRSRRHMEQYLHDDQALVVFSGLHSPPLLAHRDFINQNHILVLDPWAAAGPITRYPSEDNWIFRLSVDDSKAGYVIVNHAVRSGGFKKPILLLETTGWGRSNKGTMTNALGDLGLSVHGIEWFNWNLGLNGAKIILRKIAASGADVILLVANAPEGKVFVEAMFSLPPSQRLPIRSHWGITGGDFPEVIGPELRREIDLYFIQTAFSFISFPDDPFGREILQQARELFPNTIDTAADIKAPTGFIHAYDLTRLLIAAVDQASLTGDIVADREKVRNALENLDRPVKGLIKTYVAPFGTFSAEKPDAHEALSIEDFVMAYYGEKNEIILDRQVQ